MEERRVNLAVLVEAHRAIERYEWRKKFLARMTDDGIPEREARAMLRQWERETRIGMYVI